MTDYQAARARLITQLSSDIKDRRVLDVMSRIPREKFVSPEIRDQAYDDRPLPIGKEQTISQPYIIALMTESLELKGNEKVLEIGTGSGYQTAILAELASRVVTIERVPELAASAGKLLKELGYKNIEAHLASETLGWPQDAPYDAIMVTAGAPDIPDELLDQLAVGGRMIIPVGPRYTQELCKVTKRQEGIKVQNLGGCRFVSLIGKSAWQKE
jgi:protein-L-isoaspartate(D-aspartate) O-methyltransferase